jgi:two-component system C4-dicarboxylate transport sensor histidine kinase DctB
VIFDSFFTRKENGTGLGLSIAKRVAVELGGDLRVCRSPLGGAKFVLEIPVGEVDESVSG